MANLTLSIDDHLLKRARIRAIEQDTSVNALVRDYLGSLAEEGSQRSAIAGFLRLAKVSHASSGQGGRRWTRSELHER